MCVFFSACIFFFASITWPKITTLTTKGTYGLPYFLVSIAQGWKFFCVTRCGSWSRSAWMFNREGVQFTLNMCSGTMGQNERLFFLLHQGVASVEKAVEMFCPFFILYVHVLTWTSSRRERLLALSTNTWETVLTLLFFFLLENNARFAVCLLLLFFFCPLKWQVLFQSQLSLRENEHNSCQPHSHYG